MSSSREVILCRISKATNVPIEILHKGLILYRNKYGAIKPEYINESSIAIPTTTGGMYSPDFMYIVKKKNGDKELNIVIETKDVEGKDSLRGEEQIRISCAEVFLRSFVKKGMMFGFIHSLAIRKCGRSLMRFWRSHICGCAFFEYF